MILYILKLYFYKHLYTIQYVHRSRYERFGWLATGNALRAYVYRLNKALRGSLSISGRSCEVRE